MRAIYNWLLRLTKNSVKDRKVARGRRQRSRLEAIEALESRQLLSNNAVVSTFTGGDVGEGLDLDGNFLYAVDVGSNPAASPVQIRDAKFAPDANRLLYFNQNGPVIDLGSSISTNSRSIYGNYVTPTYGTSSNDSGLAQVMSSIRALGSNGNLYVNMNGLTIGVPYKLQLMFADASIDRGFDIFVNQQSVADEFNPGTTVGSGGQNKIGAVVTYEFVSTSTFFSIELRGLSANFVDKNPILNAFTLEDTRPVVTLGTIVNTSEGFGYGSTIAGLGGAVDTTSSATAVSSALKTPLNLNETGQFTMESWFYPKAGQDQGVIWNYSGVYQLLRAKNNGLRLVFLRSGGAVPGKDFDITVENVWNADAWNHLATTFDGDTLRLFVNGVEVFTAQDKTTSSSGVSLFSISNLSFQTSTYASGITGSGEIDEVRVWNIARTQSEIQETSLTKLAGTEPGLIASWDFDHPGGFDVTNGNPYRELDNSPSGNSIDVSPSTRIQNAAPQIGYIDVNVNVPVTNPAGLFVTYSVSTDSALDTTDYYSSRFRVVSDDPSTEKTGIIIPYGESTGRIYFTAKQDTLYEPTENITVALTGFNLRSPTGASEYLIGAGTLGTAKISILDSGAYTPGVAVTDGTGRAVSSANPLFVDPAATQAFFQLQLTSQPTNTVRLRVGGTSGRTYDFTPTNWDFPQPVLLPINGTTTQFAIEDLKLNGAYLSNPATVFATRTAPLVGFVTEGSSADLVPVKPTVSLITSKSIREDEDLPALVNVILNTPAPVGGLDVKYSVLSGASALSGVNYQPLSGIVHVEEGLLAAQIPVYPIRDGLDKGSGVSLTVSLTTNDKYLIGGAAQAIVTISNVDQSRILVANPSVIDVPVPKDQTSVATTATFTTFSSSYATLTTIEPTPSIPISTEPNNTPETAYKLDTAYDGLVVGSQVIDVSTDVDLYRFKLISDLGRPDTVQLVYTFDPTHSLQLDILNPTTGALIKSTPIVGPSQYLDLTSLADGEYLVKVRAANNSVVSTSYALKFKTLVNPSESNNNETSTTATYLGTVQNGDRFTDLAISSASDVDYYRFTLKPGANRPDLVNLVSKFGDGNLVVDLLSTPARTAVLGPDFQGSGVKLIPLTNLPDGDYILVVRGSQGSMNKYDLAFGLLSARQSETDPNQVGLRLDAKPTANVTLNLTLNGQTEGRLSTTSLVFTPSNWDQYQVVTVTPLDDGIADGDKTYQITASANSQDGRYQNKTLQFPVTNVDRGTFVSPVYQDSYAQYDVANAPTVSIKALPTTAMGEGQTVDAFRVSIDRAFSTDFTVFLDYGRGTAIYGQDFVMDTGEVDPRKVVIKAGTTFTIIRATLLNDEIDEYVDATLESLRATIVDTKNIRVPVNSDPGYDASVSIFDNNRAGYTVVTPAGFAQNTTVTTDENPLVGAGLSQITLNSKPAANVTVYLDSSDPTEGLLFTDLNKPAQQQIAFVFTPDNWSTPQKFYLRGVDDSIDDGNLPYQFVASSTSDDLVYNQLAKVSYNAVNSDNDTAGITVTSPQATVSGRTNVFSVVLNTQPQGEVRVTATPQNEQIFLNSGRPGDPLTLVFNPINWNIPQLVQAGAFDDSIVEYVHTSQINFTVSTGRLLDSPPVTDVTDPTRAYQMDRVEGGFRWTNLSLPTANNLVNPNEVKPVWLDLYFPTSAGARNAVGNSSMLLSRIQLFQSETAVGMPTLELYSADGKTLLTTGLVTPTKRNSAGETVLGMTEIPLLGVPLPGHYLVKISGNSNVGPATKFTLQYNDADRAFDDLKVAPVTISIKDNDLPSAEVLSGPTASEISSQPSYFSVRLNAPAPATLADAGIKVNFQVTGGRASVGTNTSTLHDYSIIADEFNPLTGRGMIRIAPGDIQANIGIVPIDDKLVEDLPVTLSQFNGTDSIKISAIRDVVDATAPYDPKLILSEGTVIRAVLSTGDEIEFTIRTTTDLNLNSGQTDYSGVVPITITGRDKKLANDNITGAKTVAGRVKSEDIQITLLGGLGYVLPLAPDKQNADPTIAANLDQQRTVARLAIFDDDVPGVQIIEKNEHTTLAEGETTTFQVALTAEPRQPVILTLTPSSGLAFVNPVQGAAGTTTVTTYSVGTVGIPKGLDLTLVSVNETDLGYTAVFDSRLTRVTDNSTARTSTLTLTDANGSGSDVARYLIPGTNDVDLAGNPEKGNWNDLQRLEVANLKRNDDGSFTITLNLDGASSTLTLTPSQKSQAATTTSITFNGSNWYLPQTVTIRGVNNGVAEPGAWYMQSISYALTSQDPIWKPLVVPPQDVHLEDVQLDVGETVNGLTTGLNLLQDSLLGMELPLLGTVGDLPKLEDLFNQVERPLEKSLGAQEELTVNRFQQLAESALKPLVDAGILDTAQVVPSATANEVRVNLHLDKKIKIGSLDLSSDLGLDALGVRFQTTGKASATIAFNLDLNFGWSQEFGFFIDTESTGLHMGISLGLEGNGATSSNPGNLFTGQGSLGFLQLDFADDSSNRTQLGVTFDVMLHDLDNLSTVKFFDVNSDGILNETSYTYQIGSDTNNDGRLERDANGNPITSPKTVAEAWANVAADGKVDQFPTPTQLNSTSLLAANAANWNSTGESLNAFTEGTLIRNEGEYTVLKRGNSTLVFLDLNRDGHLNIGRRNADPFAANFDWTSLNAAEKNSSEIWFKTTNPQAVTNWKILTTGTGTSTVYYVDVNRNNVADTGEVISPELRKKLDKNKNGILDADIVKDAEGEFVQGTSVAFYDTNGNKKLDFNEPFISYAFDDFQLSSTIFSEDAAGNDFLDLNGDGENGGLAELSLKQVPGTDNVYLDFNRNGAPNTTGNNSTDLNVEPQIGKSVEIFKISQKRVNGTTIILGDATYNVVTIDGVRFIDLDGNGELTRNDDDQPVEPFAHQLTTLTETDLNRLALKIDPNSSSVFTGLKPSFDKLRAGTILTFEEQKQITDQFNKLTKVVLQPSDGNRLTLDELLAYRQSVRATNNTATAQIRNNSDNLFTYTFQGNVNLGLTTRTSVGGNTDFPSFQFDLAVNIPLFNFGNSEEANDDGMTVNFNNVAVDLGSFLGNYMKPIVATANDMLNPIRPVITALNADTKIFGFLGLASSFEVDGKPGVSLLEIARKLTSDPVKKAKIDTAIKFASTLQQISDTIDTLSDSLSSDQYLLTFGDFSLSDLRAASKDPANAANRAVNAPRTDGASATRETVPATTAAAIDQQAQNSSAFKNVYNKLKSLDGLKFNLFDPATIFSVISGEDNVQLITYDIPDIEFEFNISRTFSIWGPLAGKLEGGFNIKTDLSVGYDTHGFQEWADTDFAPNKSYLVFDGFFLNDLNSSGVDKNELTVSAFVGAGLGLDIGIASGFVKGGIQGTIGLDFVDAGERAGTSDGRVRGSDIIEALAVSPADLFKLSGTVSIYLGAEVSVDLFFFSAKVYDKKLATFQIAKFTIGGGTGGTTRSGTVQTGTTIGATVWLDVNNNGLLDENEPFTLTDNEGHYDLIVPDEIDFGSGPIRVQGGIDATTGLPATDDVAIPPGQGGNATALTALEEGLYELHLETTVADINGDQIVDFLDQEAYNELLGSDPANPRLDLNGDTAINLADQQRLGFLISVSLNGGHIPIQTAQQLIESSFAIDPSVDLSTFLHLNEALAGNSLAVPVMLIENQLNTLVTQVDAVFSAAAAVSQGEPGLTGVFSEATFEAIGRQLLQGNLDLTDRVQLRAIILDSATHAVETMANQGLHSSLSLDVLNAKLDTIVDVIYATMLKQQTLAGMSDDPVMVAHLITAAKIQTNGPVANHLYRFVIGELSSEDLLDDTIVDAEHLDQIIHTPLPPIVSQIPDVSLVEDGAAAVIPFTAYHESIDAGTLSFNVIADDSVLLPPEAFTVTPGDNPGEYLLTIHPGHTGHGVAYVMLEVIDSTGSSFHETFAVFIDGVDDPPVANPDQYTVIAGQQTKLDPVTNDTNSNGQALHLGIVSVPEVGDVLLNNDQTVTFTAGRQTSGIQSIGYQVDNGNGGVANSVVTVNVIRAMTVAADQVLVNAGQAAVNSGTIATGEGLSGQLSASVGTVTNNSDGTWSWRLDPINGAISNQTVTISVDYSETLHDSISFTVQSTSVTPPPTVINVPENRRTVTTVSRSGIPAGRALTFTISGGADQSLFSINRSTGALRFIKAPDFETPLDANQDNVYLVTVTMSNGGQSVQKSFAVTVTNVAEGRVRSTRKLERLAGPQDELPGTLWTPMTDILPSTGEGSEIAPDVLDAAFLPPLSNVRKARKHQ